MLLLYDLTLFVHAQITEPQRGHSEDLMCTNGVLDGKRN